MDKLVEGLALVEDVNRLIEELQEALELFQRGEATRALEKINSVEEGIDGLNPGEVPERSEIEEKLSQALANLEWVSDNDDRVKRGKVED